MNLKPNTKRITNLRIEIRILKTINMGTIPHPTFGNGKICYIEIPAINIHDSASFYYSVFGWNVRTSNDGLLSFDDGVGEVSGTWVVGPKPASETGFVISIMVSNIQTTIDLIKVNGGRIIQEYDIQSADKIARFTDPAGNVLGLYEHKLIS
jgi:predicted enzyme related to lactoylglutathione lyase